MQLSRIRLRGYRCMRDVTVTLGKRTLLIGGNGAGKTSLLEAIDKVFGAGRRSHGFREQDLAPGTSEMKVDLELRPDDVSTFTPEEHALFETHVDVDDRGDELVLVRVVASFEDDGVFRSRGTYMKCDGDEDGALDVATRAALGFFYLPSARDARREFEDRAGLWSRLTSLLEAAHDPDRLAELTAEAGRELVGAVLGADRLDDIAGTVQQFVSAMYDATDVEAELRATAIDFRTLLRRTSLVVGRGQDLVPLAEHSTGLQTLALFGLFRAFLDTAGGHLLAAGLEEPEIHLAPHVARSLVELATDTAGQVLLTSHSPSITNVVPVVDIRVLRGSEMGTLAKAIEPGLFDDEELARLHRELRTVGTEFLFARAVLLCEGPSEQGALPEFAAKVGTDLDRLGVSVLPVGGGGFRPYLKLLGDRGFDIPHAVICDNDQTLTKLLRVLRDLDLLPDGVDEGTPLDRDEHERLRFSGYFAWPSGDFETYLVEEGGYEFFEEASNFLYGNGHLSRFRERVIVDGVDDVDADVIRRYTKLRRVRKPELAAECAARFSFVPDDVSALVEYVVGLASDASESES